MKIDVITQIRVCEDNTNLCHGTCPLLVVIGGEHHCRIANGKDKIPQLEIDNSVSSNIQWRIRHAACIEAQNHAEYLYKIEEAHSRLTQ